MHHVTNLCCSMLYKRYKSDLIKSGKDLFPGASETERLAERLAVPLLLLLRLLFSLSSDADLLPKMNEWCAPGFRILSQPHTHTHTRTQASLLSLLGFSPPTPRHYLCHSHLHQPTAARRNADKYRSKRCSSYMHTNKNKR